MSRTARSLFLETILASSIALSCSDGAGSSDPAESHEPKCALLCDPDIGQTFLGEPAGCDDESTQDCVTSCEERIKDATSLCATCLLQEAEFYESRLRVRCSTPGPNTSLCDPGEDRCRCEAVADGTMCGQAYQNGETRTYETWEQECFDELFPSGEATTECDVQYLPVQSCAEVCAG